MVLGGGGMKVERGEVKEMERMLEDEVEKVGKDVLKEG